MSILPFVIMQVAASNARRQIEEADRQRRRRRQREAWQERLAEVTSKEKKEEKS